MNNYPLPPKPGELDYFSVDVAEPKDMTFSLDDPGDDPKIVVYGREGGKPNHVDYDARQVLDTRVSTVSYHLYYKERRPNPLQRMISVAAPVCLILSWAVWWTSSVSRWFLT